MKLPTKKRSKNNIFSIGLSMFIITIILGACNSKPPIYSSENFLKEKSRLEVPWTMAANISTNGYRVENKDEEECIVFQTELLTKFYFYNLETKEYNRLNFIPIKHIDSFRAIGLDTIYGVEHDKNCITLYTENNIIDVDLLSLFPEPPDGRKYLICSIAKIDNNFGIVNFGRIFDKYEDARNFDYLTEKDSLEFVFFNIKDTIISRICFAGKLPEKHPMDNYFSGKMECTYNDRTKECIFFTALSEYASVWDNKGEELKEVYFSSRFHKPLTPFKKENRSIAEIKHYYETNSIFSQKIVYDEFRNVYLRVMKLPENIDEDALIKENKPSDWVLIVADENFNIKYEVLFKGEEAYRPYPVVTKKGVFLIKTEDHNEDKTYTNADLFIFD